MTDPQKPPRGGKTASRGDNDSQAAADDGRTADQRLADHAAIDRLAEDLLPALAAKLSASGLAEIDAAKADGRWAAAYQSQRNATVPPDLAAALAASPQAAQAFGALSKTERYAMILKLITARTTTARTAWLRRTMTALEAGTSGGG